MVIKILLPYSSRTFSWSFDTNMLVCVHDLFEHPKTYADQFKTKNKERAKFALNQSSQALLCLDKEKHRDEDSDIALSIYPEGRLEGQKCEVIYVEDGMLLNKERLKDACL